MMNFSKKSLSNFLFASKKNLFFCLLSAYIFVFLTACGQPPCEGSGDCMENEQCIEGACEVPENRKEPKQTEPKQTEPKRTEPKRTEPKPTEPKEEKKPVCSEPRPTCNNKGICENIEAKCQNGSWHCTKPKSFEKEEYSCDGKDNDCDGKVDEDCDCVVGETKSCGVDVGACQSGSQVCQSDGRWGTCKGEIKPQTEICDGKDNDCDGQVDEKLVRSCYSGPSGTKNRGICSSGRKICENGQWSQCQGERVPQPEVCDGKDNNCDGQVDEKLVQNCYDGPSGTKNRGICRAGTKTCQTGVWSACEGMIKPQPEVCDGKDNNCDGRVDENIQRACYTGPSGTKAVGSCKAGTQICQLGQWGSCEGESLPEPEKCDGVDNNCDGSVDENLQRACYTGPVGTKGKGSCRGGIRTCQGGKWSGCQNEVKPQSESCDGVDNDCDGFVDESPRTICGYRKVCQNSRCSCDASQGSFLHNGQCLKEGDICPASLRQRSSCATKDHWLFCDPHGRVAFFSCSQLNGTQCVKVTGGEGCQALKSQYSKGSCMEITSSTLPKKTWQAVMTGVGLDWRQAILVFDHCVGQGRNACSTIVTAQGYQATCSCGERQLSCGQLGTLYDVSFYNSQSGRCEYFWGSSFGCPEIFNGKNACGKRYSGRFSTYTCGF